jgi:hypothetical protein
MTTTKQGAATQRRHALLLDLIEHAAGRALREALAAYEATGDHDHSAHGTRPIPPGGPCGLGDDCWVRRARAVLAAIEALSENDYRKDPT